MSTDIVWRCLEWKGHEYSRLEIRDDRIHLSGTAVFVDEGKNCRLSYTVDCDAFGNTVKADVKGFAGEDVIDIEVLRDESGVWTLNGTAQPQVSECLDIDLNFSPSTNLLPIRRLNLNVGEAAPVQAAWLIFPSFTFEVLSQTYQRTSANTYHYESHGGSFVTDLTVNDEGMVTHYPDLWEQE